MVVRLTVLVVLLVGLALPGVARAATAGPGLSVDAGADQHAIAPEIYGMSYADPALAAELALPLNRWGGNTTDRYNWTNDSWNTGSDWFFETTSGCWNDADGWCSHPPADPKTGYRRFFDSDHATGTSTLLTLPMVGWVAKAPAYSHPLPCSFTSAAFPSQGAFDPYDAGCGNGLAADGSTRLTGNDPTLASTPSTPALSAAWIADIRAHYAGRGAEFYGLGNEPALWDSTHRDVHPAPTTYDELRDKAVALATAVKQADPQGKVLGFSEWGWPNYECSAADGTAALPCTADRPDRAAHGGQPLVTWFLDQMRAQEEAHGTRLLDYLDLHYYAQGGSSTDVTRSLWDPTYTDPSWIGEKIRLIPRMHEWVDAHYPGTKLSLSEYDLSLGGADATTNTLIQADSLGIFAREGLDMAVRWNPPGPADPVANAFRMFRDYDGAHGTFGATWVRSTSADQARLAVYAARRAADGALTVLVLNKSGEALDSRLDVAGFGLGQPAQRWEWTGGAIARRPDAPTGAGGLTATFPARSMTMLVLHEPPATTGGDVPATTGATGTPAPAAVPAPAAAPRLRLPRRCIAGRRLAFTVRHRFARATIRVGGHIVRAVRRPGTRLRVRLAKLPRRTATVTVTLTLPDGTRLTGTRRYRRC